MALCDPVAVYNSRDNVEAHLMRDFLEQNGIEAYVTLDDSLAGVWMFGLLPEIHKPQVWIDQSAVEAARPLLKKFEHHQRLHATPSKRSAEREGDRIKAVCEECGKTSVFGGSKNGTVQDCPHCGAYMDVGDNGDEHLDS
jgi:hypothetical protein